MKFATQATSILAVAFLATTASAQSMSFSMGSTEMIWDGGKWVPASTCGGGKSGKGGKPTSSKTAKSSKSSKSTSKEWWSAAPTVSNAPSESWTDWKGGKSGKSSKASDDDGKDWWSGNPKDTCEVSCSDKESLESQIAANAVQIAALQAALENQQAQIDANAEQGANQQAQIGENTEDLNAVENQVIANTDQIDAIENGVLANAAQIDAVENQVIANAASSNSLTNWEDCGVFTKCDGILACTVNNVDNSENIPCGSCNENGACNGQFSFGTVGLRSCNSRFGCQLLPPNCTLKKEEDQV